MEFLYIFALFFLLIYGAVMLIKTLLGALLDSKPAKKCEGSKDTDSKGA